MKKFHAFAFNEYYPGGGIDDLLGSFETLEEAKAAIEEDRSDRGQIVEVDADGDLAETWGYSRAALKKNRWQDLTLE